MVNLPNPPETQAALQKYHDALLDLDKVKQEIAGYIPVEVLARQKQAENRLAELKEKCREAARTYGDYKDEQGWEARIEKRVSVTYLPQPFREVYPEFAAACIEEVVNKEKVKGLLKGGLITEGRLEPATERRVTEAFILR